MRCIMTDVAAELSTVLSVVLGVSVSKDDEMVFREQPSWDSMKHIEIIMAVEEKFGISFDAEAIPRMTSQAVLLQAICEMRAAQK